MDRDYWGRYYPGAFKPLSAATWTHGRDQKDSILLASEQEREKQTRRYRALGPMGRVAYQVFHGLCSEYETHRHPAGYLPKLRYWALRLQSMEERGM